MKIVMSEWGKVQRGVIRLLFPFAGLKVLPFCWLSLCEQKEYHLAAHTQHPETPRKHPYAKSHHPHHPYHRTGKVLVPY